MNTVRQIEAHIFDRINPAVRFSVTRYVLSIGVFVAIVAFGIISALGLGVDLLPSVNIPSVSVSVSYPGAAPTVVDQQVTQILENAVSSLSGITDLSSQSSLGSSRVSISFDTGTDRNEAVNQVASLVNASSRRLPSGAASPVVRTFDSNQQPIIQFGVSGGGGALEEVASWVERVLTPALERVAGVANVQIDGAPSRQFQVLLDPNLLRFYNLGPQQIVSAISSSAVNQPIGTITTHGSALSFSTRNVPANMDQLRRILVDTSRGLSVADLGAVREVAVESNIARIDGTPVVLVSIQRTAESNSVAVADGVRALVDSTRLPSGYEVRYGADSTGPIRSSVEATYRELLTSAVVVAVIVLLFLGRPGTAIAVILAIPISLAAAPILYRFAGFSFNLVSLLALITAIGIVVDDSIVVAENVERYRGLGFGNKDSVLRATSEIFGAAVASTLSLVAVLIPVSFVGGFIGRYIQQFALGLAAAVAFSLLEALFFLTVRMAYASSAEPRSWRDIPRSLLRLPEAFKRGFRAILKPWGILGALLIAGGLVYLGYFEFLPGLLLWPVAMSLIDYALYLAVTIFEAISGTLAAMTDAVLNWLRDLYARSIRVTVKASAPILILTLAAIGAAGAYILPKIPFTFVPQADSGFLQVNLRFPQGTPQMRANEAAVIVEGYIMSRPEVAGVQTIVGGGAEMTVRLTPVEERQSVFVLAQDFRRAITPLVQAFPSTRVSVGAGGGGGGGFGGGNSLQISVTCPDYDLLRSRSAAIVEAIQSDPFVVDVSTGLTDATIENRFVPDPSRLKGTGITPQALATALQTYASGSQAANLVSGGLAYPIRVMIDPTQFAGGQSLLDLPVYSSVLQASLPIGQLGRFELAEAPTSISRLNRQYSGNINMNLTTDAPTVLEMQERIVENLASRGILEGGITVAAASRFGQAALTAELQQTGPRIFLIALFLTYIVMAAQFNSWRYPIYLLLPVPLALVGAVILVYLLGGGLDIFGLMGLIMLIGASTKPAILLLEFVVERMGTMPFVDALVEAGRLRFRPIMMTTLTTVVIAFPLIFSKGQGSEYGGRLGIVMLGGMILSTFLTLFIVPAAFYLFERKRVEAAGTGAKDSRRG